MRVLRGRKRCISILKQFNSVADEKLIEQIRLGDSDVFSVLVSRYGEFLERKICSFTSNKDQHDDYMQEAILSFFTAVNTFDDTKSSFRTYLNVCVTRTLITLKRKLDRHQDSERPMNDDFEPLAEGQNLDPQSVLENREQVDALMEDIKRLLSDFELKALTLYLGGGSYESIAKNLNTTAKSVDNALQRVRLKLKSRI